MSGTIMVYGAAGYSGQLIAAELARERTRQAPKVDFRLVLAGRRAAELERVRTQIAADADVVVFPLDDIGVVRRRLRDTDLVINAAGPFSDTAVKLAKAAIHAGCHYVDINGEADVYTRLDDLGRIAKDRGVALVCGAGHTSAASGVLLHWALGELRAGNTLNLGAIRIVMSGVRDVSRGSVRTAWRQMREQVTVARERDGRTPAGMPKLALVHEPVGRFERMFDFGPDAAPAGETGEARRSGYRSATLTNLIDTLAARNAVMACDEYWKGTLSVKSIESYVEADTAQRLAYQAGSMAAPFMAFPVLARFANAQIAAMIPEGPTRQERDGQRHTVLLQIEDVWHRPVIDWRLRTPNVYDSTAKIAVAVALRVLAGDIGGWQLPGTLLSSVWPRQPRNPADDGLPPGWELTEHAV